jgi:hypothetical protein
MKNRYFLLLFAIAAPIAAAQAQNAELRQHLKTDITYLASDDLQGRLAGSPGEKLAADYIAAEFQKAGLKPLNGSTFQTFNIIQLRLATSKCELSLYMGMEGSDFQHKFALNEEYYPISESSNYDSADAELLYVGHGIEADAAGLNDYKDLENISGKIFIITLGFPGDDTLSHSPLAAFADISTKLRTAISKGAVGVIFIPGTAKAEIPKGELQRNATPTKIPVFYFKKTLPPVFNMKARMKSVIAAPGSTAYNVMGYRNNKKKNTIIICAHHDHLGYNEYRNSLYTGPQEIHNGADDNASGVAAMLELARTLKGKKYKKNNYLFIGFSGEEIGLLGSKYFINNLPIPKNSINYVVNIDMLGRLDSSKRTLVVYGTGTSPVWNTSLSKVQTDSNLIRIQTSESGLGPSDHASFYLEGIPVLHYFTGQHEDYHKPSDDEYKINYAGMEASLNVITQMIANTNKAGKLEFTKTKDVQPGRKSFKVTMGIMPDYTYGGEGLLIDAVSSGKPAEAAGLQRGDIVTQLGQYKVSSVQDYMQALGNFEKGQTVEVTIIRAGANKTLNVTFQ